MKKVATIIILLLVIAGAYSAWQIFGASVHVPEGEYLYVKTGTTYPELENDLIEKEIIGSAFFFNQVAKRAGLTENVKAGKYKIEKGMSIVDLARKLKRGQQEPVRLVINKLRTKEDLAKIISRRFEADSAAIMQILLSNDSLQKFQLDTHTVMTSVIPNTYFYYWNLPFEKILSRLQDESEKFWNAENRLAKAKAKGLTPEEVYIMASIVEEETNKQKDKELIASVYINRIKKGMKLEADPTVKYASRDFGLKRIYFKHLEYPSTYNTYIHTGLPPGPICTPAQSTIDAVLNAPETDYIFFVAKPDLNGYSNFASTYQEHLVYARAYRSALDKIQKAKNEKNQTE